MKHDEVSADTESYEFRASRVAVIGLDCASPRLLFDRWLDRLPTLASLCRAGICGELTSVIPPITVPAWACMMSGKDPGELGVYGFRNRRDYSYADLSVADSRDVCEKRVWDYLGDAGLRSVLLGVPQTYPARPFNGISVGCFLAPEKNVDFTYPRRLRAKIDRWAGGKYIVDVKGFRTNDKAWLLEQIHEMTRAGFRLASRMLEENWDFFMMVEMGVDRLYHGFWRYFDKSHFLYKPGNPYENAILDYHIELDELMGGLLKRIPEDTLVLVVSDHGARPMRGAFAINEWLRDRGLLTLIDREYEGKVTPDVVDWKRTRVWVEGGYYARLFFNVEGREPEGALPASEYDSLRRELKAEIAALRDPEGRSMNNQVYLPEEIYSEAKGIPPDLIVLLGGLDYRSIGTVGHGTPFALENDTGPDDANHDMEGLIVAAIPDRDPPASGSRLTSPASIYDVAPTIMRSPGLDRPPNMKGKALELPQ